MATTTRGKVLRDQFARGRGTCPICNRTGIKLLYTANKEGKDVKVCKNCRPAKVLKSKAEAGQ